MLEAPGPFNWARLANEGARTAQGDLLLFLNNDVVAQSPGWLAAMVGHAQRPEIGAVGARLVFPDGRLPHCGTVIGLVGPAGHVMAGLPPGQVGYVGSDRVTRNWTAVTAACLSTRREVWAKAGGFDESLPVASSDVDFCLKPPRPPIQPPPVPSRPLLHPPSSWRGRSMEPASGDLRSPPEALTSELRATPPPWRPRPLPPAQVPVIHLPELTELHQHHRLPDQPFVPSGLPWWRRLALGLLGRAVFLVLRHYLDEERIYMAKNTHMVDALTKHVDALRVDLDDLREALDHELAEPAGSLPPPTSGQQ